MTEEAVEHHGSELNGIPRRPGRGTHTRHSRSSQRSCKACGMTRLPSGYNEVSLCGWKQRAVAECVGYGCMVR